MSDTGKGYVVRGKIGPHAVHADRAGGEYAYADVGDPAWRFDDVTEAHAAADHMTRCECADVRIYDADTGAVVPTYAEALARLAQLGAALTDAQVEGFAQTAMDDICKGTERPRNAVARAIRAALNAARPEAPPLTAAGAMALWERAYLAALGGADPDDAEPDAHSAAMLAGHQAVLDAVASPAGSEARTHAMEAEIDYRVRRIVAQRTADKLAEMDALLAEAPTPDLSARAESGPMRFGDDWAGVFLRGDYAGPMGMYLRDAIDAGKRGASPDAVMIHALDGLASTLSGCDERGALDGLQQMRPFAACVAHGTATPKPPATVDDGNDLDLGDVEAGDRDRDALSAAHRRIAALPTEKRHEAMRRLSRSYSAPVACIGRESCRRDGDEIVWPDGERWPTRTER